MVDIIKEADEILKNEEAESLKEAYLKAKRILIAKRKILNDKEEVLKKHNAEIGAATKEGSISKLNEIASQINMA